MTKTGNGIVEFRFYRPGARDVRLVGDFNGWSAGAPMQSDGQGWWLARVELAAGDYRFRYVADGTWYTDFAAHGVEVTKLGWNSVLVVPPAPLSIGTDADSDLDDDDARLLVA